MTLDNILEEINKAKTIVILTHENPDGDAIGSSLALYNALKSYGKNPDVIIPEYSRTFEFLPGTSEIKKESSIEKYDLAISLDCATIKMLNGFAKYFENAKTKIAIDHHGTNTMYADLNFVNPDAPACAQILIVILNYFHIEITKDIGTCILAGIITDTGGFKYSGVTAETFEFVAWLLNKGVNVSSVYRKVLQTRTKSNFELNRDIEGVEVSIFIREVPEKGLKISLRSNEYVNVSDVALLFGGGGHPRAAGCNMRMFYRTS